MIKVYGFGFSRWVRPIWLLGELGVPFEAIAVDPGKREQKDPDFLAKNPFGKVPVIVDGDRVLFESGAILLYLADTYGEGALIPSPGTFERAQHDQWLLSAATELEPPLWRMTKHRRLLPEALRIPADVELATSDFRAAAEVFDHALGDNLFFLGDRLTAVDVMIGYLVRWARLFRLLSEFERLASYEERLTGRPAFPGHLYPH
jgi:glutathione S-transferase